ncbi:hypothetical protein Dimus_033440 [Dionaea muscipula]
MVEEENRRLRAELEKEKAKGKRSRERLVLFHNDFSDMSLKNERLHNTLNETSGKLIKIMEKRHLVEARLPKQLNFMTKEAQREYLESDEFVGMFNRASGPIFENGWRPGVAQVRRMLKDDYPLIPELDQLEIDVKVPFQQEEILKIKNEPTEWSETYDIGILSYVEEWGKEIADMFPMPSTFQAIITPPASAVGPHLAEFDTSPSPCDNVSKEKRV